MTEEVSPLADLVVTGATGGNVRGGQRDRGLRARSNGHISGFRHVMFPAEDRIVLYAVCFGSLATSSCAQVEPLFCGSGDALSLIYATWEEQRGEARTPDATLAWEEMLNSIRLGNEWNASFFGLRMKGDHSVQNASVVSVWSYRGSLEHVLPSCNQRTEAWFPFFSCVNAGQTHRHPGSGV